MIQLNLTPQETIMLYGLLEGTMEKLTTTELPLNDRENTFNIISSVMFKIVSHLDNQTTNN